ncbi:hypothetical protein_gp068 [Bacillus phage vB_BceM_WH1]|nr:hypothetical protein_gp068 [Bacillus phage vB_BceM_WH1]
MKQRVDYRPTVVRANAPFRGPTTIEGYHNFVQESVHDLRFLYTKIYENEGTGEEGLSHKIDNNFNYYTHGQKNPACNVPTSTSICKTTESVVTDKWKELAWEVYGQCKMTKQIDRIRLENPALDSPCGIRFSIMAEEGDRFYVRILARGVSGNTNQFAFGSESVNARKGHFYSEILSTEKDECFDTRFSTDERGMVTFNIDVSRTPSVLEKGVIDILSYEVWRMEEVPCNVSPLEVDLKPRLDYASHQLKQML